MHPAIALHWETAGYPRPLEGAEPPAPHDHLAVTNAHPRDQHVFFNAERHQYGVRSPRTGLLLTEHMISATALPKKYAPPFRGDFFKQQTVRGQLGRDAKFDAEIRKPRPVFKHEGGRVVIEHSAADHLAAELAPDPALHYELLGQQWLARLHREDNAKHKRVMDAIWGENLGLVTDEAVQA